MQAPGRAPIEAEADGGPPTWPVAAGSLVLGFAVADATGVRPLGGIVLLAGAGWCVLRWRRRGGTGRAVALTALYAGAFAVSHPLGGAVGAWPAVVAVAAATGLASWALADARGPRRVSPAGTGAAGPAGSGTTRRR